MTFLGITLAPRCRFIRYQHRVYRDCAPRLTKSNAFGWFDKRYATIACGRQHFGTNANNIKHRYIIATTQLLFVKTQQHGFMSLYSGLVIRYKGTNARSKPKQKKSKANLRKESHAIPQNPLTVSILGPPNAGKSTLFNRLMCKQLNKAYKLGIDKSQKKKLKLETQGGRRRRVMKDGSSTAIVSSIPGTTRDRRDCWGRIGGTIFRLMDTAGVNGYRIDGWLAKSKHRKANRKVLKAQRRLEQLKDQDLQQLPRTVPLPSQQQLDMEHTRMESAMMEQTLEAAKASDLIFLMMDAKVGMTQDLMETARWLRQQNLVGNGARSNYRNGMTAPKIVVLANKLEGNQWLYEDDSPVTEHLDEVLRLGLGPAIPISAQHGEGMADLALVIEQLMADRYQVALDLPVVDQENEAADRPLPKSTFESEANGQNIDVVSNEDDAFVSYESEEKPLQLAIVGRPNVGKSTLVNALLQQERVLTGATPGLTRDAIAVDWSWNGRPVQLVDTAGIRKIRQRPPKPGGTVTSNPDPDDLWNATDTSTVVKSRQLEDMAVANALRAIQVADVVVLVLDAQARYLHRQEVRIANAVIDEGRSLVVAANKWDLLRDEIPVDEDEEPVDYTPQDYADDVRAQLEQTVPMLRRTPIVPMSGLTGEGIDDLLPAVFDARERWAQTISTSVLNRWLEEVLYVGVKPSSTNRSPTKIKYILQAKGRPPTFLLFCNNADVDNIPESFVRYLTKHFQDTFEMYGMPVRMIFKPSSKSNPFDKLSTSKKGRRRGGYTRRRASFSGGIGGKEARKVRLLRQLRTTGKPAPKRKKWKR